MISLEPVTALVQFLYLLVIILVAFFLYKFINRSLRQGNKIIELERRIYKLEQFQEAAKNESLK